MTVGITSLHLAQYFPNHPEIRITSVRIAEGPLYIVVQNDNYYWAPDTCSGTSEARQSV
jgi:hypothetical protein